MAGRDNRFERLRSEIAELRASVQTLREQYNALAGRTVGRPLAASDAQRDAVLKLHKAGKSLRTIAAQTNLGLRTVRTIVDQQKR
jgi:DNA-binding NarL/FixJ family response regulator